MVISLKRFLGDFFDSHTMPELLMPRYSRSTPVSLLTTERPMPCMCKSMLCVIVCKAELVSVRFAIDSISVKSNTRCRPSRKDTQKALLSSFKLWRVSYTNCLNFLIICSYHCINSHNIADFITFQIGFLFIFAKD